MTIVKVPLYGNLSKAALMEAGATKGAQVGVNLTDPDGNVVQWNDILNVTQSSAQGSSITTTDDLDEGAFNLYFTDERAQDAVGGILVNSANVTMTYNDAAPSIEADLTDISVVSGGVLKKYGFDTKGRRTQESSATTDDLAEGTTNLYFTYARARSVVVLPVVTGDVPPVLVYAEDGSLIYTEIF